MRDLIWDGEGVVATTSRAVLTPPSLLYAAVTGARNALYDAGVLRTHASALPVISVGNLTVGGTGKTPLAAWIANEVALRGTTPAIVLRGYGGDEPAVHAVLSPQARVIVDADRVRGVAAARAAGATVAILDDAFQHRRIARDLDLVLISADRPWPVRALPAGPLRESMHGVHRADLVIVTRKSVSPGAADVAAARALKAGARDVVHVNLVHDALQSAHGGEGKPLAALAGARVLSISGIGDPVALRAGLVATGARVEEAVYADHHAYTAGDVTRLTQRAGKVDVVVCTLKDAVKLRGLWPRSGPVLWYVSQRVEPAGGSERLFGALDRVCTKV